MTDSIFGVPNEIVIRALEWSVVLMFIGLLVDALGRRKGEPEAPAIPELHRQIDGWLKENQRLMAHADTRPKPKRI